MRYKYSILFLIFHSSIFAQLSQDSSTIKQAKKKWVISVNANTVGILPYKDYGATFNDGFTVFTNHGNDQDRSYSLGINVSHFLSADFAVRVKLFKTQRKIITYVNSQDIQYSSIPIPQGFLDTFSLSQNDWGVSPGIFYQIHKKKFSFYCGLDIEYISHSKTNLIETQNSNSGYNYFRQFPKGSSFGIGSFLGTDFFVIPQISLGTEFSLAFLRTNFKGLYYNRRTIGISQVLDFERNIMESYSRTQLTNPRASISLSFWF